MTAHNSYNEGVNALLESKVWSIFPLIDHISLYLKDCFKIMIDEANEFVVIDIQRDHANRIIRIS